jgi:hypothetical protein
MLCLKSLQLRNLGLKLGELRALGFYGTGLAGDARVQRACFPRVGGGEGGDLRAEAVDSGFVGGFGKGERRG